MLTLLLFLVATAVGPLAPPEATGVHDLAAVTDAEARQLAGRRALFRVVLDSEPAEGPGPFLRYECRGDGGQLRTLWLREAESAHVDEAREGSGLLLVEATLLRIAHPPVTGADGPSLPALV